MESIIKPKELDEQSVTYLLSLTPDDITLQRLEEFFANKASRPARFQVNDFFTLPKEKLSNDKSITTTVGRYIFNLLVLSPNLIKLTGYINDPVDSDAIDDIDNELSSYLIEDKITVQEFVDYLDKLQWLGFSIAKFVNASLTYNLLIPPKETMELKDKLIAKYKKELDAGDLNTIDMIEKELIADAKMRTKDIPDYQIYASGGRGSFKNNYKNTSLMRKILRFISAMICLNSFNCWKSLRAY